MRPPIQLHDAIARVVREDWGRILASLTKTLGDIQLAEDSLQDAVEQAMRRWPEQGLPKVPRAWLITTARRRAIDRLRRAQNFHAKSDEIAYLLELEQSDAPEDGDIPDKRLEMIFTCCHPALEEKTQIALTLRTLGGLSTGAIAAAFLDKPEAMAQRLVRAKKKISAAGIAYKIPERADLPERLGAVLRVIYLIFNEGYAPKSGDVLVRRDLSEEAIRLARIVTNLMPEETEVTGLLALMLFHDSRRVARTDAMGDMIALEHQDRGRWNRAKIQEADRLLKGVLGKGRVGPYQLQAAVSGLHSGAASWEETDWPQIAAFYAALHEIEPSPIVRINQAVAVAYGYGVESGLRMLREAGESGALDGYQPYHAALADLLGRSGALDAAMAAYARAIELTDNAPGQAFLEAKAAALHLD